MIPLALLIALLCSIELDSPGLTNVVLAGIWAVSMLVVIGLPLAWFAIVLSTAHGKKLPPSKIKRPPKWRRLMMDLCDLALLGTLAWLGWFWTFGAFAAAAALSILARDVFMTYADDPA